MRNFKINRSLDKIEVRYSSKPGVETTIAVNAILRPVIPQITLDILKVQKRTFDQGFIDVKSDMKTLFNSKSSEKCTLTNRLERYKNCSFYPFSILLEKGGRIEVVAPNY